MSATSEPDARAASDVSRTQEAILAAYAELIEELGTDDVSFRLIARRAGVGERTVFRNYATRVDLLLATAAWIERRIFPRQDSPSIFDMPLTIRAAMESYDQRPELAHVVAETTMRGISGAAPSPRRAMLEEMIDAEIPALGDDERRAIVAALGPPRLGCDLGHVPPRVRNEPQRYRRRRRMGGGGCAESDSLARRLKRRAGGR